MPIGVNHSPGYSQYGQAMYDSSRNVENYDRYQKLMELLMQRRQMEQQQNMQEAQLAEQKRQFDESPDQRNKGFVGFNITNPGNPVQTLDFNKGSDIWDRLMADRAARGLRS